MVGRRDNDPDDYRLPDPSLRVFDHGLGELRVDGELKGHLASIVGEMRFPSRQPWPWFLVVWLDGTKEPPFEDYGPQWLIVRELDAGRFDHFEPSVRSERRFLWMKLVTSRPGPPRVFEFVRLPLVEAAQKWRELGLEDSDF